jgi:hypothetical protein
MAELAERVWSSACKRIEMLQLWYGGVNSSRRQNLIIPKSLLLALRLRLVRMPPLLPIDWQHDGHQIGKRQ